MGQTLEHWFLKRTMGEENGTSRLMVLQNVKNAWFTLGGKLYSESKGNAGVSTILIRRDLPLRANKQSL